MANGLNKFLSVALIVSSAFSVAAQASNEVIQIRTAKIDKHMVAITPDLRLMGIHCKNGDMVFADAKGEMNMDTYRAPTNRGFLARSPSRTIAESSVKILCESPLNSEFDIVISDKVRVLAARSALPVDKFENATMVRTFKVNKNLVGVTENYRLVGIDCDLALLPSLMDLTGMRATEGRIVLQNDDGTLPMENYAGGRTTAARAVVKPLTDRADDSICHGDSSQVAVELDLVGIREAKIDVFDRIVNARAK